MITVYTVPMCSDCMKIKEALKAKGYPFVEVRMNDYILGTIAAGLRADMRITRLDEVVAPVVCESIGYDERWLDYAAAKRVLGLEEEE